MTVVKSRTCDEKKHKKPLNDHIQQSGISELEEKLCWFHFRIVWLVLLLLCEPFVDNYMAIKTSL